MKGLEVERVTDVEYDNNAQEWVARLTKNGAVISRGRLRDQVLREEVVAVSEIIFGTNHQLQKNEQKSKNTKDQERP